MPRIGPQSSLVLASCNMVTVMTVAGQSVGARCLTVVLVTSCGTLWHVGSARHVENWSEETN